jgi:hypothetical protein
MIFFIFYLLTHRINLERLLKIETIKTIKLSCLLNLSKCYIQLKEYENSIRACDSAIEIDSESVKAYHLRAKVGRVQLIRIKLEKEKKVFFVSKMIFFYFIFTYS